MLIIESLVGLLEKHRYETISVSKITQEALVARNSFYRNFNSKEEIIQTYIKVLIDEYSQIWYSENRLEITKVLDLTRVLFPFFKKQANFIKTLKENNLISILQTELAEYIMQLVKIKSNLQSEFLHLTEKEIVFYITFHSAGICQVLVHWIETGCRENEEEMAMMLASFISKN